MLKWTILRPRAFAAVSRRSYSIRRGSPRFLQRRQIRAAFSRSAAVNFARPTRKKSRSYASSEEIAALTVHYSVPATHHYRKFVEAGGVLSYGSSETDNYRLVGAYVGRILKGAKPADLPVQQATKLELVINLKAAKALGLTVPPSLLA